MDKTLTDNYRNNLFDTVKKIVSFMNLECQLDLKDEVDEKNSKTLLVSINTPENARLLIGKNGENLKSLEHLLRAMFLKKITDVNNIVVDVNDYRRAQVTQITDIARQAVAKVRSLQKAEVLFPMSAYERRIVHMELASYPDIATESIGAEPNRRIVIKPFI